MAYTTGGPRFLLQRLSVLWQSWQLRTIVLCGLLMIFCWYYNQLSLFFLTKYSGFDFIKSNILLGYHVWWSFLDISFNSLTLPWRTLCISLFREYTWYRSGTLWRQLLITKTFSSTSGASFLIFYLFAKQLIISLFYMYRTTDNHKNISIKFIN